MNINALKFKNLLAIKNHSQKSLSDLINKPTSSINAWVNREVIPDKYIEPINKALNIDLEAYFLNDGIDLIDELSTNVKGRIPFYDIDVFAGDVSIFNDNSIVQPTDYYYLPNSDADFFVPLRGDSMYDKLNSGDELGIKIIHDMSFFAYGREYLIITEDYKLCKQIRKHKDSNKIILHSYNSNYDDIELPIKKILHLGCVVDVRNKKQ